MLRLLARDDEDDVVLRRIDIDILEEEYAINALLLESRELDEQLDRSYERFLNHEILLSWDLERSTISLAS